MKVKINIFLFAAVINFIFSAESYCAERIQPEDLIYKGAFRVPAGEEWQYSGYAMTYYADGDPKGRSDGYPGSLFILGHDHHQRVAEVSIPMPVVSDNKDPNALNTASVIQKFADVRPGMFGHLEIPRAGIAYLPKQGSQKSDKLHFCWGQHFQDNEPSHGWCELDLSGPNAAGPWHFGGFCNYVTNDYLFEIPRGWAEKNAPGRYLATGRFRDGLWSGRGPALFAYGPWDDGNPPKPGSRLTGITPLLLYGEQLPNAVEISGSGDMAMKGFKEADEWSGGSWLTAGNKAALVFIGTKATGKCWYGYANGVVYPISGDPGEVYPELPPWPYSDRGWWSEGIEAQFIFFDVEDLAKTAKGTMKTYEPQPYAVMGLDGCLFDPGFDHETAKRYLTGAMAFDRDNSIIYAVERRADDERPLIHVWRIGK